MARERILVVDDEQDILELIRYNLSREGYQLDTVTTGEEALKIARDRHPDLIILDLMLPGIDGLDVCRLLKGETRTSAIPIIMLTAKGEDSDVVTGLELGAEDYMTKPFSPKVLIARVRNILRRKMRTAEEKEVKMVVIEDMKIDPSKHKVTVGKEDIDLTATEFALLMFLAKRPGWVFTRSQIINGVKGDDYPVTDRSVDVQILNLRKKLGTMGEYIETVRGVGYRFKELS
ncbi:MAG TPA: response regulator transcription factor [bacterium]|nr:response regulator transcription factor [bacterium]